MYRWIITFAGLIQMGAAQPTALAINPQGTRAIVAIEKPASLAQVDIGAMSCIARIPLPNSASGLVLAPDGKHAYVTAGTAPGYLLEVDLEANKILRSIPAGHSPLSPVLSADHALAYVGDRFNNCILVVNLESGAITGRFPVIREPIAAVLSKDGRALFVANHLPAGRADSGDISAAISVIDVGTGVSTQISLPNGSTGTAGIAISPDGADVCVTHTLARYGLPTTQVDRGWMNTSALSVIDAKKFRLRATVLLDDIHQGAANPWGVACSADGKQIHVAHSGTHEVSTIDRKAMLERIAMTERSEKASAFSDSPSDVSNDLAFLSGIRKRIKIQGQGPRSLAVLPDGRFVTGSYFSGGLHIENAGGVRDMELVEVPSDDPEFRGEALFYDATACFQNWQSCATCHPGVRNDALNWDLLNDGMGNPKQAKSMLFSVQTPPVMISGIRDSAEVAIRAGIQHIQFTKRPERDTHDIGAFLRALQPVPSPALVDGQLTPAAERGKEAFKDTGCINCHSGEFFTDQKMHDVGTAVGRSRPWDTPTLREVWRTAPYLHDGRAPTLESLFRDHNPDDRHGDTSELSDIEFSDLIEYIRSI